MENVSNERDPVGCREKDIIRTFWHGSELSVYEELSLLSFARLGHKVQVYSYRNIDVPAGVEVVDAENVLPSSEVFAYRKGPGKGSYAAFSDVFRYKMLYEFGGTWVDADVLCLKPFHDLPETFAGWQDEHLVNNAVMRLPCGHRIAEELYCRAAELGKDVAWGQAGPRLLTEVVMQHRDQIEILPQEVFYPIHWSDAHRLILPEERERSEAATINAYCVHWWNEILRRMGLPRERVPPAGSYLYRRALEVFERTELDAWPKSSLKIWVENYRSAQLMWPLNDYFEGKGDVADLLRNLGVERLEVRDWTRAVELLSAAHALSPDERLIRLHLARALIGNDQRELARGHLEAASKDPATRDKAREIGVRHSLTVSASAEHGHGL